MAFPLVAGIICASVLLTLETALQRKLLDLHLVKPISSRLLAILLAMLTALYRTDQLRGHIGRALDNGVTREEIGEVITHMAFYAGWPAAMTAGRIARKVFDEARS